ncbi:MAG: hypothetical protein RLY14_3497, partial [Planctomycetota bacterium]
FGSQHFLFSSADASWSLTYRDLWGLAVTPEKTVTECRIGDTRVISVKGLGINRRSLILALSIIVKCVHRFYEGVRQ